MKLPWIEWPPWQFLRGLIRVKNSTACWEEGVEHLLCIECRRWTPFSQDNHTTAINLETALFLLSFSAQRWPILSQECFLLDPYLTFIYNKVLLLSFSHLTWNFLLLDHKNQGLVLQLPILCDKMCLAIDHKKEKNVCVFSKGAKKINRWELSVNRHFLWEYYMKDLKMNAGSKRNK